MSSPRPNPGIDLARSPGIVARLLLYGWRLPDNYFAGPIPGIASKSWANLFENLMAAATPR
ncbi:MAG: hypothetical protein ACI87O_000548 [Planctomycetota bacterium]|jgi:hypothetical protein